MSQHTDRFSRAIEAIDAANAADPNTITHEGATEPKELVYGRQMSGWLIRLDPAASEPLRLAVRAQHIRRWEIPRKSYPDGRAGYLQWRKDLQDFHARMTGQILDEAGYDADTIERVKALLHKARLKSDPDSQTLEDVACLVFLEHYFAEFAAKHPEDKLVKILAQTWRKMSPKGRETALALALPPEAKRLVEKALA
jgi:hypothetical protein